MLGADIMLKKPSFFGDEKGAVTIEFTVLVPFFIFLLVLFADASVIYFTHSEMFNAARDISRRMSTGQIETEDQALAYASERLYLGDRVYTVDVDFASGDMPVSIGMPVGQAAIFGVWFGPIIGDALIATARTRREPMK